MILLVAVYQFFPQPGDAADRRALLVGVQSYHASISDVFPDLKGPENDLVLMRETLRKAFGSQIDISVLGGMGKPEPTRRAILDGLDRLAGEAAPGDEIILYFSGHGAQLPSPAPDLDEPDGLDEIFLPSDTELIHTGEGYGLRNHLRDTEIGARIDRMERAGAFVWLIVDSCHAGTMLRGSQTDLTPRLVDLQTSFTSRVADLNPPPEPHETPYSVLNLDTGGKLAQNRLIAFYAASPDALAFELPTGSNPETIHGLFTISLAEALLDAKSLNFSDLARETSARMWARAGPRAKAMYRGALQTPLFEAQSLASQQAGYAMRFDASGLVVLAGRTQGLLPGTILSVEVGAGVQQNHLLTTKVVQSGLDVARLAILPDTPATPNHLPDLLQEAGLPVETFADRWLADRAPSLTARLSGGAIPAPFAIAGGQTLKPDLEHELIQAVKLTKGRVRLKPGVAQAVLDVSGNALMLRPSKGLKLTAGAPLHVGSVGMSVEALSDQLARLGAARSLVEIAQDAPPNMLTDVLKLQIARVSARRSVEGTVCELATLPLARAPPPTAENLPDNASLPPRVGHCDQVFLTVKNTGAIPLDVSPLYVSADGVVYYLSGYPRGARVGLRVPAGASRMVQFTESVEPALSGTEATILLLALPSSSGPARDFRHLTTLQATVPAARQTRGRALEVEPVDIRYNAVAWRFTSGDGDMSGGEQ